MATQFGKFMEQFFVQLAVYSGYTQISDYSKVMAIAETNNVCKARKSQVDYARKAKGLPPLEWSGQDYLDHVYKIDVALVYGQQLFGFQLTTIQSSEASFSQKLTKVKSSWQLCERAGFTWTTLVGINADYNVCSTMFDNLEQKVKDRLANEFFDTMLMFIDQFDPEEGSPLTTCKPIFLNLH
jgi:hypothetical protein